MLSSQLPREGMNRHIVSTRSPRGSRNLLILMVLLIAGTAAAIAWKVWPDTETDATAPLDAPLATAAHDNRPGPATPRAAEPPAQPEVPTLVLGVKPSEKPIESSQSSAALDMAKAALAQRAAPIPRPAPRIEPEPRPQHFQPTSLQVVVETPPAAPPATQPTPGTPGTPASMPPGPAAPVTGVMGQAMRMIREGQGVEGRRLLSGLLISGPTSTGLTAAQEQAIREALTDLNRKLVFSSHVEPGDPLVESHAVKSGDLLVRIARQYKITADLLSVINNKLDPKRLQIGQKIKVIKGPFHAVVDKSDFRIDLYLRDGRLIRADEDDRIYICSFAVGLGSDDSTPVGAFAVKNGGKVSNPGWTDPRTGKYFEPDNLQNPIGEYWIGLEGTDEKTQGLLGYGIHGTIEPESIGKRMSMGCIRLGDTDIATVYTMLADGASTVQVRP